jgi:hypothetical protein
MGSFPFGPDQEADSQTFHQPSQAKSATKGDAQNQPIVLQDGHKFDCQVGSNHVESPMGAIDHTLQTKNYRQA